jgi:hypothetical protein
VLSPGCYLGRPAPPPPAAGACAATFARSQLQPAVRLDLAGGVRSRLLVLAGAGALPEPDAVAARRYVEAGGDALVLGKCAPVDEEGRVGEPLFPEVKSGLEPVGEGRVFMLAEGAQEAAVSRAIRELSGRGRAQITLAGRGHLFARAYLDPERKLDVHLENIEIR